MRADSRGVAIEYDAHGDPEGRPVLLLHGFPDSARLWRRQVPALVDAGFRVLAPDLRGFGRSDKPDGVGAYAMAHLATDVVAVLDHAGAGRAHVVGHDFGAALSWVVASLRPDRVDHLVAMSVGFPSAFADAGWAQREKSWYMLLFQFEGLAETWLAKDDWANMRAWASSHPDIDEVIAQLDATGSLTPGLNWYRANVHPRTLVDPPPVLPRVQVPTMGVWSALDFALTERQMVGSGAYVDGGWRYERVDGAGHWLQLEAPDHVNALLVDFLPR